MARSMRAFLNARDAALTASPVIGPVTNWSISSLGIFGSAADFAAISAFFNFVLLGITGPLGHVMPRTQNSGQARALSVERSAFGCGAPRSRWGVRHVGWR